MIGREKEKEIMLDLLASGKSEFLAVTGRRRIGKTYLIDTVYKDHISFSMTGIQNGNMQEQLTNFIVKLSEYDKMPVLTIPKDWQEAFILLKTYLKGLDKNKKKVIFFDEVPWIYTPKSKFIQMMAHFWNDYLSKENNYILVVCGSATSWLTKKIVNDKGGLHNRITKLIKLSPFNLYETQQFFKSKKINLILDEIIKIYMAFGGVPYYLEQIKKGESSITAIERLCFEDNGILKYEYNNLYKALFNNPNIHENIVKTLATSKKGLTRNDIIKKAKINKSGTFNRALEELLLSDFISIYNQFGRKKKESIYKLNDEYSLFYHRFIKPNQKYTKGMWAQLAMSQSYKIWTGYAFESICHKHVNEIKKALGISAIYAEISTFQIKGNNEKEGLQIDLIIDRKDSTINLCEIKYHSTKFKIDKKYALQLEERKQKFIEYTKTKKQVFITFISNKGIVKNQYYLAYVDSEVLLEDLFIH